MSKHRKRRYNRGAGRRAMRAGFLVPPKAVQAIADQCLASTRMLALSSIDPPRPLVGDYIEPAAAIAADMKRVADDIRARLDRLTEQLYVGVDPGWRSKSELEKWR